MISQMGLSEKIIFLSILGMGAIVGVITYTIFSDLPPTPGDTRSIYRQDLTVESSEAKPSSEKSQIDPATIKADSNIKILEGAATQGNPDYEPDEISVKKGDIIKVDNADTVPHTITNGEGPNDSNSAKIFDTGIINAGDAGVLETDAVEAGEYTYYCTVHPYMIGKLTIA